MFLCSGEALFDMFVGPSASGDPLEITLDGRIGGSPLNVALGLARMGNQSDFFTRVSADPFGERIRAFMAQNNISDRYCIAAEGQPSTLAIVSTRDDGHPRYDFYYNGTADCSMIPSDIPQTLDDNVEVLHFGSFATVFEPTGGTLRTFAKREAGKRFIAYDPNIRAMVVPDLDIWRSVIDEMSGISNFVKASDEDLELLYPGKPLEAFIETMLVAGADIACVTRGGDGVIIGSADGRLMHVPGRKVNVVDTVGAGDTFQAASLHFLGAEGVVKPGMARDVDIAALAGFAVKAAAVTCSRRGANLPTLAEIEALAD